MAMDDRIRTSDADRERVTGRLRDHFAEGRLTREELDERVTAALNARTFGELRRVLADLPEPAPVLATRAAGPGLAVRRRGPGILPLVALMLLAVILLPGSGWVFLAFLQMFLVFALVVGLGTAFAAHRFRRRMHRHWQWQQSHGYYRSWDWPRGF
jgi:Domain of unknown function (DUF1707)